MMIDKNRMVKVINKYSGTAGYTVEDLGVHRNFYPGETKEISFEELEKLSFTPGGDVMLQDFLEIKDEDVVKELFNKNSEPEYHYTKEDIKRVMEKGTLDQFLDCLDFAPEAVKDMIKDMAVDLPLNDVAKRKAIMDKFGFDVDKAIEIKNTKYDSGDEEESEGYGRIVRRTSPVKPSTGATAIRRATPVATPQDK